MIPGFMTRQIGKAQDRLLSRLLNDAGFAKDMATHSMHAQLGNWLPDNPGGRVLELGCGPGKYVAMLSSLGYRVVGVDPFEFPTWAQIKAGTQAELVSGISAERLPFPDQHFDAAVCLGALLYFESPAAGLRELHRVVKPGGAIVVRTVNSKNFYTMRTGKKLDPASRNLYEMDELIRLVESCGFKVKESFAYGFWPPMLTNFWWYMVCVWLPIFAQDWMSAMTPRRFRVNNTVFLVRL